MTGGALALSYWKPETDEGLSDIAVGDLLAEAARLAPNKVALVDGGSQRLQWTYADLLSESATMARGLLSVFEPGERVAVWSANRAEWIVVQYALALAGLVMVTANPAYRDNELRHVLHQSQAVGLIHAESYRGEDLVASASRVRRKLPLLRVVLGFEELPEVSDAADLTLALPHVEPLSAAQIQYTSGTTGFPKGAVLHHYGLVNATRFVAERNDFDADGVYVNAMPLFHMGGCGLAGIGVVAKHGTHVVMPGFDAGAILETIERERGTTTLLVPTMLLGVLDHPDCSERDLSSLRSIMTGAAPVPSELGNRVWSQLGVPMSNLFGQTEVCGVIAQTRLTDAMEDQVATIGQPLPHVELKIADPTGEPVPVGGSGEICTRGYQTMLGYFNDEESTSETIDGVGWLHHGDLGSMDDRGFLKIDGRLKEMIIRGGENIFPREVEDVLLLHPHVAEAAVLGVPDDRWGEVVIALIRTRGEESPSAVELREHCRRLMAPHKTPSAWYFVSEFPLTSSGKIQKRELARRIAAGDLASS